MRYGERLALPGVSDMASARGQELTRTNQGSSIIYITEKPVRQHAQSTTSRLFVEASLFRLTDWFHSHLFLFIQDKNKRHIRDSLMYFCLLLLIDKKAYSQILKFKLFGGGGGGWGGWGRSETLFRTGVRGGIGLQNLVEGRESIFFSGPPTPNLFKWNSLMATWYAGLCTRTVIDIHFFSIRSLTFYFSIPIISIRFWRTALIEFFHMFQTIFVARILRFSQCKHNEGWLNTLWLITWVSLQNSY